MEIKDLSAAFNYRKYRNYFNYGSNFITLFSIELNSLREIWIFYWNSAADPLFA